MKLNWLRLNLGRTISGQILMALLLVSSCVTIVVTIFQIAYEYKQDIREIEKNLILVKKSHLEGISKSLWNYDEEHLKTQLNGLMSLPGIRYVEVKDAQDRQVIEIGHLDATSSLSVVYPLIHSTNLNEKKLGHITISATLEDVYQKIYRKIFFVFISQFLKTVIVTTLVYFIISRILVRHLICIAQHVKGLDFRNQTSPLILQRRLTEFNQYDELAILTNSVNYMQQSLFQSYQELNSFNQTLEKKVEEHTTVIIEQRSKLEYSAKMAYLGEMARGVAHEMNTPLAALIIRIESLEEGLADGSIDKAETFEFLTIMKTVTSRIGKIIRGMLLFSRDRTDDPVIEASILEIVESAFDLCRERIVKKGIRLDFIPGPDIRFWCRPNEITHVLLNLLDNAEDAAQKMDLKWIRVELSQFPTYLEFSVIDSGPGIPTEIQNKVMQPFFTTKEVGAGPGLGLSIAKGIIESHGGEILIDTSCPNTKITSRIPFRKN